VPARTPIAPPANAPLELAQPFLLIISIISLKCIEVGAVSRNFRAPEGMIMKPLRRTLIALLVVLACAGMNFAQGEGAPNPLRPQRIDRPREPVTIRYEKSKDETVVYLNPMLISDEEYFASAYLLTTHNLFMQSYFIYPGKKPSPPQSVVMTFVSLKHGERYYQKERGLSFNVDGDPVEIGEAQLVQFQMMEDKVMKESVSIEVPYDKFMRVANAKKVRMKLGKTEWDLKKQHLKSLRDYASRAQP
jgi:hypothetical protein